MEADQGDRRLRPARPVDGAGIDEGDEVATSLIETDGFDVVVRRHERDATTASGASSVLNAIQQGAASAATRDETIDAQHVPTLDSWLIRDESKEIFAVDRDERGKIRWPVDGVVDDYRLDTPAVPE
ncbi:MAG TPA: hypothetical protein VKA61_02605 [Sphingomicrobium sp.]|nr:hypothetical protein [Sphingomicrobium sp.]